MEACLAANKRYFDKEKLKCTASEREDYVSI